MRLRKWSFELARGYQQTVVLSLSKRAYLLKLVLDAEAPFDRLRATVLVDAR